MPGGTCYCEKCRKTMDASNFYKTNNIEKYPDGRLRQCKKCITMHVDNWDPDTYLWILQEADVPYVPEEWDGLMARYARDKSKTTGSTILGRYLGKMRLKNWKDYRWKDTEFLRELSTSKVEQAMKQRGYDQQEIAKTLNDISYDIPEGELEIPEYDDPPEAFSIPSPLGVAEAPKMMIEEDEGDFQEDLTEDDKIYLRLKWGKNYKPSEWVQLEQLYNEMMDSYDIQQAGDINTLKLACKCSLKANQLIDIGDIDGAQKSTKMYNDLMKSGKWTAAQNKAEGGEVVDSVGELIELCEKQGYIERFYSDGPNDKVDFVIKDMQRYTRSLIEGEADLGNLIEIALKQNAKEDEDSKNMNDDIVDEVDASIEDIEKELKEKDYEDYADFQQEEINDDDLKLFLEGDK